MKSRDLNAKDAVRQIAGIATDEEISEFMEGEDRKSVIECAQKRLQELQPKQGQTDEMTRQSADFKQGLQRTKCLTCEDVIKDLRQRGKKI